MKDIEKCLDILKDIDKLYIKVLSGNKDVMDELDILLIQILEYDDLSSYNDDEIELISLVIKNITDKVNLIYKLLDLNIKKEIILEDLEEEFKELEMKRFETVNRYVMGMISVEDIDDFKKVLFDFRDRLYAIQINDTNILRIAKMKSKVQHFDTEILEDEDVLRVAYANSN
ncbi:MAG TPA: hypothetical protein IAC02_06265 [Candidatus Coprovivens excrementavium]|nr:hypothetical protein [Candidatus Coprovivens excrementavium]